MTKEDALYMIDISLEDVFDEKASGFGSENYYDGLEEGLSRGKKLIQQIEDETKEALSVIEANIEEARSERTNGLGREDFYDGLEEGLLRIKEFVLLIDGKSKNELANCFMRMAACCKGENVGPEFT